MPNAIKGQTVLMTPVPQTYDRIFDIPIDCQPYNAVSVQVTVAGTNPSADIIIEGAPTPGGHSIQLPDTNAAQTGITADKTFDVIVGQAYARVRIQNVTGTFAAGQGYSVWITPFVSPGSARVAASIVVATLSAITTQTGSLTVGTGGQIASGASAFMTGDGYWLAYNSGTPQFRVGKVSGGVLVNGIAHDGAALQIKATNFTLDTLGNVTITGALTTATGSSVDGQYIVATSVTANKLNVSTLSAITANMGTITAGTINATATIQVGALSGDIASGNLQANAANAVNAGSVTISGGKITANSIAADRMNVSQLSAITANMGSITAGTITGGTYLTSANVGVLAGPAGVKLSSAGVEAFSGGTTRVTFIDASTGALTATSASVSGAITASSGSIGSFTIGTYLYTGTKTAWNDANVGVHLGSDGIGIGNNVFTVNGTTGALVATSATITGTVNATAGYFGNNTNGVNIDSTGVTIAGTGHISTATTGARVEMLASGIKWYDATTQRGQILNDGSGWMGSSTAFAWTTAGVLTAGSFTIGTYLYTGTKTAYNDANAGVHLGSDGIGIANNVFTVSAAGALVATSATITGAITASSGSITGPLTMSGASSSIAIGTTPPTSATVGTGLWLDRTGLYGLSANTQEFYVQASDGRAYFGGGNCRLDTDGITLTPGLTSPVTFNYPGDSNNTAAILVLRNVGDPTTNYIRIVPTSHTTGTGTGQLMVGGGTAHCYSRLSPSGSIGFEATDSTVFKLYSHSDFTFYNKDASTIYGKLNSTGIYPGNQTTRYISDNATNLVVSATVSPVANDGAALGTGSLTFSDLFLASGAVINLKNGDVTITHADNTLTWAGATVGYIFNDGSIGVGMTPAMVGIDVSGGGRFGGGNAPASGVGVEVVYVPASNLGRVQVYDRTGGAYKDLLLNGGMYVYSTGGVVVGAPTGGDKGAGTINAVSVYRNGTALDFVFSPDYELMPIHEMRTYYESYEHLPTIPTRDVHDSGSTNMGALTDRLWETAEVHAIYISQLEARVADLERQLAARN